MLVYQRDTLVVIWQMKVYKDPYTAHVTAVILVVSCPPALGGGQRAPRYEGY